MITVLGRRNSNNVKKVLLTLEELGLAYQQVDLGGNFGGLDSAEFLALNPNGMIPCLKDGDFVLWESNAIVRYLIAQYGHDHLVIDDIKLHAAADKWMDWVGMTLFPTLRPAFLGLIRTPESQRDMASINHAIAETNRYLAMVNQQLESQDYLSGDLFGMADIALLPVVYIWFMLQIERPEFVYLERWYKKMQQRESFKKIVDLGLS